MFDIGWSEMLLIIVVVIIVVGPKDLPRVMRTMGNWVGRMRAVARHFQENLEQMADESGLNDARREVEKATQYDVRGEVERAIDPEGEIRDGFSMEPPEARAKREAAESSKKTEEKPAVAGEQPGKQNEGDLEPGGERKP